MRLGHFSLLLVAIITTVSPDPAEAQEECLETVLVPSAPAYYQQLGESIDTGASYVVAGSPRSNEHGTDAGAVIVFRAEGGGWIEDAKLYASDAATQDFFGYAVAVSGDRLAVGARGDDDAGAMSGSVYVFERTGGNWIETGKITPRDATAGQQFGYAVDLQGDELVVGAPYDSVVAQSAGAAYVFTREELGWVQQVRLTPADTGYLDTFGYDVVVSGDDMVIGAVYATPMVYRRVADTWVEQGRLQWGNRTAALDGDYLVTGGFAAVHVYKREGPDWVYQAQLDRNDPYFYTWALISVSIADGYVAADGRRGHDAATFLFKETVSGWVQQGKLPPTYKIEGAPRQTVSILGDCVAVGASGDDTAGYNAGAVYIYRILGGPDCDANTVNDACQTDCNDNGVPEVCDPFVDCNADGEQDSCEVLFEDCNDSGVPDDCDIADGTSQDCNVNGVPDECIEDEVDCNSNSVPDECDITDGTSNDCNGNGIPDECELDCNGNGLPEDCEPLVDCNGNGEQDACDLRPGGGSEDCNENEIPDECDIAAGTSEDCNRDGVPDECQPNGDCNENGIPDLCDLGTNVSRDCHGNLVPDECELADGTSQDLDGNGVPDDCECTAPMFALVPVDANGQHSISSVYNQIFVAAPQQVWLEVQGCGWDPDQDGVPVVRTWEATIDSSGYMSGLSGTIVPWNPDCADSAQCVALLGGTPQCNQSNQQPPGGCTPGFWDYTREPSMYLDWGVWVTLATLDYRFSSYSFDIGVADEGAPHYAGSVVVDIPPDAAGTFSLGFVADATSMHDQGMGGVLLAALRPARITIAEGCCLPNGSCTLHDPQSCADLGGTPSATPCEGDCDGNGVADACEYFDDCNANGMPDACDLQNGRSEDVNTNGIPDGCEMGACCACPGGGGCLDTSFIACNDTGGHFTLDESCASVTCPTTELTNDDCANALTVGDGVYPFDNRCATTDGLPVAGDMCIWDGPDQIEKDVWFEFVTECEGWAWVEASGEDFDPLVAAYCAGSGTCGCLPSPSREFACDGTGLVQFPVEADRCYQIRVGGALGTAGTLAVDLFCAPIDCIWYSALQVEPIPADKNRFLSFQGGYPGRPQAVRVTLTELPAPFDHLEGQTMWVGPPQSVTEASGSNDDTPPTFTSAKLECQPHLTDWSALGVVHVTGEEVMPGATYELDALDAYCLEHPCYDHGCWPGCFWETLVVNTGGWGDVVGDCSVTPCSGPDDRIDFVDIMAVVDKFTNQPNAPVKARVDLTPDPPNGIIDFVDISWVVAAFRGHAYPYDGAAGCQ